LFNTSLIKLTGLYNIDRPDGAPVVGDVGDETTTVLYVPFINSPIIFCNKPNAIVALSTDVNCNETTLSSVLITLINLLSTIVEDINV
jgi:hypothetical protein